MSQLHKRFTDNQVKELLVRYMNKEIESKYIQEILGIGKTRFFALLGSYQQDSEGFSIQYHRHTKTRTISSDIEGNILKKLSAEKKLIQNKDVPLRSYNYSYIKDQLRDHHQQNVSLSTIIRRAKQHGFYLNKPKKTAHDREVLTRYTGELIQHDSSHHLWAPASGQKWYLITSLDDHSRFILYAKLLKKETSWAHIQALQTVFLKFGLPFSYYVDSHSIFRYVRGRDTVWYDHSKLTDEADPQWKQVLEDCGVKLTYALSPQAKGKIERPYQWLQDRLIRSCVHQNVTDIRQAHPILNYEIQRYNFRQVHSTTQEVPYFRFQKARKEKKSLFREFRVKPPYHSVKDIFCFRLQRTADSYRKISINNLQLRVNEANPGDLITIRHYPISHVLSELRFWRNNKLLDVQKVKNRELLGVHF